MYRDPPPKSLPTLAAMPKDSKTGFQLYLLYKKSHLSFRRAFLDVENEIGSICPTSVSSMNITYLSKNQKEKGIERFFTSYIPHSCLQDVSFWKGERSGNVNHIFRPCMIQPDTSVSLTFIMLYTSHSTIQRPHIRLHIQFNLSERKGSAHT